MEQALRWLVVQTTKEGNFFYADVATESEADALVKPGVWAAQYPVNEREAYYKACGILLVKATEPASVVTLQRAKYDLGKQTLGCG